MKRLWFLLFLLFSTSVSAQKFGHMNANRYSYVSMGAAYPYVGIKAAYEIRKNTLLQVSGYTDGGGLWKENQYNDWRSLSILHSMPIAALRSELRGGIGIVQSEERLLNQKSNSFGISPEIAYALHPYKSLALTAAISWPISPAANLTPGVLFSAEYRIGRYVKENGLYNRRGRPIF